MSGTSVILLGIIALFFFFKGASTANKQTLVPFPPQPCAVAEHTGSSCVAVGHTRDGATRLGLLHNGETS